MRPYYHRSVYGFTLIELMIVVAIISILAAIAVPGFAVYRAKSKISAVMGDAAAIRAALSSYAVDDPDIEFPATDDITTYDDLRTIINAHGGTLPVAAKANFTVVSYVRFDNPADAQAGGYNLRLAVKDTSDAFPGYEILVAPSGVLRCTTAGNPC